MIAQGSFWRTRVANILDRHQRSLACIVSIAILMMLHRWYDIRNLPNDAGEYWHLSSPDVLGNLRFHRGYVLPVLLLPLHYLADRMADPFQVFRLVMSCIYGAALALLVPAAFQQAFGGKVSFGRRLVPVLLLAAIFPGVLLYPLSDLPALLLALGGLYFALRGMEQPNARRFVGMLAASGALMGAAYNIRTIYLFVAVGLLALLVLLAVHPKRTKAHPHWIGLAAVIAGIIAVSLPQLVINQRTHGVSSLAVQSRVDNRSLFASQLVWGMTVQRYETTINPDAPTQTVFYLDRDGIQLFNEVAGQGNLFSRRYYMKVVAEHPVRFLALYTRHVINGLDVRDGLQYTRKPSPLRTRTAVFNFAVLALAVCVAWSLRAGSMRPLAPGVRPAPARWRWFLLILLLPVLAILPGAVETRFFLPLHLLAYCLIAFYLDAASLRQDFRKHGAAIIVALAIAAGVFFAVSTSTMSQLQYNWPNAYRHGVPLK
jgi:hypothetical protein